MAQTQPKQSKGHAFIIERTFDAPRDRVWKAWTDPKLFSQWFGPKGCTIIDASIDLRPGGASKYGMEFAGNTMYGQWKFKEIKAPETMIAIVSFTDQNGHIISHPMSPDWPKEILSVVTFTAIGDKTKIRVEWTAYNATDVEQKTFDEGAPGMQQGWTGTFDQFAEFLANN